MRRLAVGLLALGVALTGCGKDGGTPAAPPALVPANALDQVLLSPAAVDTIMGTTGMTAHPRVEVMGDNRNLLPNLNCLGIWQVNEAGVYGADGWIALRQELLRSPDADGWQNLVVQSVVNYPSTDAARAFFDQSSDRWSQCTDHNVNITLNGKMLPKWHSGTLTKTEDQLAIPFTRGNVGAVDPCQRALAMSNNVIIDVQACRRDGSDVTQATAVADGIEAKLPR